MCCGQASLCIKPMDRYGNAVPGPYQLDDACPKHTNVAVSDCQVSHRMWE